MLHRNSRDNLKTTQLVRTKTRLLDDLFVRRIAEQQRQIEMFTANAEILHQSALNSEEFSFHYEYESVYRRIKWLIYRDIFNFKLLEKVEFKKRTPQIEFDSIQGEKLCFKLKNIKLYLKLKSLGEITLRRLTRQNPDLQRLEEQTGRTLPRSRALPGPERPEHSAEGLRGPLQPGDWPGTRRRPVDPRGQRRGLRGREVHGGGVPELPELDHVLLLE